MCIVSLPVSMPLGAALREIENHENRSWSFGLLQFRPRRRSLAAMKTITKKEASQGFDAIADLAHAGETVLVTHGGKPWVKLIPASKHTYTSGKSAAAFRARLNRIATKPIPGVSEVFERVRS